MTDTPEKLLADMAAALRVADGTITGLMRMIDPPEHGGSPMEWVEENYSQIMTALTRYDAYVESKESAE